LADGTVNTDSDSEFLNLFCQSFGGYRGGKGKGKRQTRTSNGNGHHANTLRSNDSGQPDMQDVIFQPLPPS
jgi:hypothetical protein